MERGRRTIVATAGPVFLVLCGMAGVAIVRELKLVNEPNPATFSTSHVERRLQTQGISTHVKRVRYINLDTETYIFEADSVSIDPRWDKKLGHFESAHQTFLGHEGTYGYTATLLNSSESQILRENWKRTTGQELPE